jgi:hypothetical protein
MTCAEHTVPAGVVTAVPNMRKSCSATNSLVKVLGALEDGSADLINVDGVKCTRSALDCTVFTCEPALPHRVAYFSSLRGEYSDKSPNKSS